MPVDMDYLVLESDETTFLDEVKYFDTRKRELERKRKQHKSDLLKQRKEAKKYYRRNKNKIKREQKLYRKKVKSHAIRPRKHRD